MFYELTGTREAAIKRPYQEISNDNKLTPPAKDAGEAFFLALNPAERQQIIRGTFMTVSVRIKYQGYFPDITYYAERCTTFNTIGFDGHAVENGPCQWPAQNGGQEQKKPN